MGLKCFGIALAKNLLGCIRAAHITTGQCVKEENRSETEFKKCLTKQSAASLTGQQHRLQESLAALRAYFERLIVQSGS